MKKLLLLIVALYLTSALEVSWGANRYGEQVCHDDEYLCLKVKQGESWESLFPNLEEQDIVKRINRMNTELRPGITIAVPKNIDRLTIYDVAPFPRYIESENEKVILVSQKQLAWAAYDENGELVWWGPISSGIGRCEGKADACATPTGSFRVIRKQDIDCISTVFPRRADGNNGGAQMPYCMHFWRGFALHGSEEVPGFRASHGCVRMFTEDARWLNEEFIDLPGGGMKGTKVIIDTID